MSGFPNNDLPAAGGEPASSPHPVSPLTDQGEAPVALGVSMSGSYVKLYRKWLTSEVSREPTTSHLFIHLLLRAARFPKDREMYGYTLAIGECDETQEQLAVASGLSRQQVRTCYKKMTRAGMISTRTVNHGSNRRRVITKIVNYETYQCPDDDSNHGDNHESNPGINQTATKDQPVLEKVEKVKKEKKVKNTTPPPAWSVALAGELQTHVREQFGRVLQDSQLDKWARALVSLTRATSLDPKPSPDEIVRVVRWGISDHEVRGSWSGWAQQLRSPPNADKFEKIQASMGRAAAKHQYDPYNDDYEDRLD